MKGHGNIEILFIAIPKKKRQKEFVFNYQNNRSISICLREKTKKECYLGNKNRNTIIIYRDRMVLSMELTYLLQEQN